MSVSDPLVLAVLISIIVMLFFYASFVPRNFNRFEPEVKDGKDTRVVNLIAKLGTEIYASLPASQRRKFTPNDKLQNLIVRAGDPWGIRAEEFRFFQVVCGILGIVGGFTGFLLTSSVADIPWWIFVLGGGALGFFAPHLTYQEKAKRRDLDFKRQLPEALDLITISLAGGNTFTHALRESIPQMPKGVLRDEFQAVLNNVDTGRSLNEALDNFGNRAPSDAIVSKLS